MKERTRWWTAGAGVVLLALAVQLPSAFEPFGGDDIYVLDNLASSSWSRRLLAFHLDAPSAEYTAWWRGLTYQRRFIRVTACALLWVEFRLFGRHPAPYHLVTSGLLAASCWMLFALLARRLPALIAALASLIPAFHPAASEVVGALNSQPLATAGLFLVGAVFFWEKGRERASRAWLVLALVCCALALTSYEAAVALPLFLVLWDSRHSSSLPAQKRWGPRLAVFGIGAVYALFAVLVRHGLAAPDTTPFRGWAEFATAFRLDGAEYIFKTVGLFQPAHPYRYWLDSVLGQWLALPVALALVAVALWMIRHSSEGQLGAAAYALFLAPPFLTRAGFSELNLPLLRQLFLPMLVGMPLLASPLLLGTVRRQAATAVLGVWLVCFAVESSLAGGFNESHKSRAVVARAMDALLRDVPADTFVVGLSDDTCGFVPSLVRAGPSAILIPADSDSAAPELSIVDGHELLVHHAAGFDIPTRPRAPERSPGPNRGPAWIEAQPPAILRDGWQRVPGATVAVAEKNMSGAVTSLRYRFDRPLSETIFVRFHGCSPPERIEALPPQSVSQQPRP